MDLWKFICVVFTRHQLTPDQLAKINQETTGGQLVIVDCSDLANKNLQTTEQAYGVVKEMVARIVPLIPENGEFSINLYGVVPTPIRFVLLNQKDELFLQRALTIYVNEAFNIQRSVEGQKPTFGFAVWLLTGIYDLK